MDVIITGLVFGLVTSFHCAGMCGPIAIALPLHGNTKLEKLFGGVLYNLGRTVTYLALGAAFGLLGQGIGALGFQRWLSIITGVLMIATVAFPSLFRFSLGGSGKKEIAILRSLKMGLKKLFSTQSFSSLFLIGILNGFLPCGPLYSAIIISTGMGNMFESMLFMLLFGLGTMPMLLSISVLGNVLSLSMRRKMANFLPVVIVIIGLLFILRGLNLGIPFLSPTEEKIQKKMEKTKKEQGTKAFNIKEQEMDMDIGKQMHCCGS
jgi:sulfite exporter TauE/SafE